MAETSCADADADADSDADGEADADADANACVDAEETVVLTNLLKFK